MSIGWITLAALAAVGTLSSTIYLGLVCVAAARFRSFQQRASPPEAALPAISVLKPVHGLEPGLEANLASFFEQDYPRFELIFCARTLNDAALDVIRLLARGYPAVNVKLIAAGEPRWPNARAFSVNRMIAEAANEMLAVTDSDVRVGANFLRKIQAPITAGQAALVTCLYRGLPLGGLWSQLEALGMSVELMSGVLVANMLEGMKFALGPATATTKDAVQQIGGMQSVGDYFADDFVLGNRIALSGRTVTLSNEIVEHAVPPYTFRQSFRHQLLWMRSARFSRPWGHIGTGLTFALPYGVLGAALTAYAGHGKLGLLWLCVTVMNRVVQSLVIGWGIVDDTLAKRRCYLYPVRDLLGWVVWLWSFFGATVSFHGVTYRLTHGGRLRTAA